MHRLDKITTAFWARINEREVDPLVAQVSIKTKISTVDHKIALITQVGNMAAKTNKINRALVDLISTKYSED